MISDLISKLQQKTDLTYDEINSIMTDVLSGKTDDAAKCRLSIKFGRKRRDR